MDVRVQQASVLDIETPLVVVNLFEGVTQPGGATAAVDQALGGAITRLIADGEITGEVGSFTVIHTLDRPGIKAQRVGVAGLGKPEEFGLEEARVAAGTAAKKARDLKLDSFATVVHGAGEGRLDPNEACRVVAEAAVLSLYRYSEFKESTKPKHSVSTMTIVEQDAARAAAFGPVVELATITTDAMYRMRNLQVGPSNYVTPTYLADQARAVAEANGLEIMVWGKDEMRANGMNAILAVNSGSAQPPAFVVMRYKAEGATKTLAVVGKGITFDTGGISLKPPAGMEWMRHDMSGAAAVIGFMELAARGKAPVNIIGVFAATENMPSGTAYKPGDVFKAFNGKTMEIVNTDAEGRVILSDSLAYAATLKPDAIVDLATLTGAIRVALGEHAIGLFSNNQEIANLFVQAGEVVGERCWQLPMWKVYKEQIKTSWADMKNTGGSAAGSITAAHFLQEFVDDIPWVHLDIAATAYVQGDQTYAPPHNPKPGPTGVGVRLIWQFCQLWK